MPKLKIVWRVSDPPTGMYRSFHHRSWPTASINGAPAFSISCEDSYYPPYVKTGKHKPLFLLVADWRQPHSFTWKRFKKGFANLKEVKKFAEEWANKNPDTFKQN